jgi:hypothetical protein
MTLSRHPGPPPHAAVFDTGKVRRFGVSSLDAPTDVSPPMVTPG